MTHPREHQNPDDRVSRLPFTPYLRRAQVCSAALFLGAVLTGPVSAQRILPLPGDNLLSGKEATFSVPPNCSHCGDADKSDLTDEISGNRTAGQTSGPTRDRSDGTSAPYPE